MEKKPMLRLRPYNKNDADIILSWSKDKISFYKWSAGVMGKYPISKEKFGLVENLVAFTAIDNDEIIGFFTIRRPSDSFDELRFGFVVVDPAKRGKGYGKAMLQLGLKFAKEIYVLKRFLKVFLKITNLLITVIKLLDLKILFWKRLKPIPFLAKNGNA